MIRSLSSVSTGVGRKIGVALSGGVDSSVAAFLLSQRYDHEDILGIHMSNWDYHNDENDTGSGQGCWEQDWNDAKSVAQHIDIPTVHVSFQSEYWTDVFEPYCDKLSQGGITPNPDVDCNRYIKFGVLKEYLQNRYKIDILATGHYARLWDPDSNLSDGKLPLDLEEAIEKDPALYSSLFSPTNYATTTPVLLAAKDVSKDQSYFLSGVSGDAFRNVLFPLGDYLKKKTTENPSIDSDDQAPSVRDIALKAKLPTANKRDSMGICFVGKRKHGNFVNEFIDGPSLSTTNNNDSNLIRCINIEDGSVLATYRPDAKNYPSLLFATSGQGAKLSGASQKWFVVDHQKQSTSNKSTLFLCPGTHHPSLYSDRLVVKDMNWIAGVPPPLPLTGAQCRIRHLQPLVDCDIRYHPDGDCYEILLHTPLRAISPGQICAIYYNDGLVCLGGGPIAQRGPTYWELEKDLPVSLHPSGHNDTSTTASRRASL